MTSDNHYANLLVDQDEEWDAFVDEMPNTPAQQFMVALSAWNQLDFQRAKLKYDIGLARDLDEKDRVKQLSQQREDVQGQLSRVARDLLKVLADYPLVRDQVAVWAQIPLNLRDKLVSALVGRGIDVREVAEQGAARDAS